MTIEREHEIRRAIDELRALLEDTETDEPIRAGDPIVFDRVKRRLVELERELKEGR